MTILLYYIMLFHVMLCYVTLHYIILHYIILYLLCYVTLHYVILYYILKRQQSADRCKCRNKHTMFLMFLEQTSDTFKAPMVAYSRNAEQQST